MNAIDVGSARQLRAMDSKVPFVSVVIPFYNCEVTVDACLQSVLAQTFGGFEVVCVNDGSTDGTRDVLEAYAVRDGRVRVLSQPNGGQASARNLGVSRATADLVAFVDGDDVCSPYYLETLIGHHAEGRLVCGQNLVVSEKNTDRIRWEKPEGAQNLTKWEAVLGVLYNVIEEGPCCKLIPRQILLEHPFPAGKLYEDLAVIGDIVLEAESVTFVEGPIYAYVMRKGSTVHGATCSIKKVDDYEYALGRLCEAVESRFEGMDGAVVFRKSLSYLRMRPLCRRVDDDARRAAEIERAHAGYLKRNLPRIIEDPQVPAAHKARVALRVMCPWLYDRFMHAYGLAKKGVA